MDGLILRLREQELLNEGLSTEDVKKRIREEKKYTELSSLLPKDGSLFEKLKLPRRSKRRSKGYRRTCKIQRNKKS